MRSKQYLKALGEEIRQRRRACKLSQEELANGAGLHRNVIGRLERGIYNPSILTLISISSELAVPISELLNSIERRVR
jgi:transcriptional regulator with XRE-family HTH domain